MKNVLYVGSGNSSLQIKNIDTKNSIVCALNNAYLLFEDFDYWIRPGDFPQDSYPKEKKYKNEITYNDYKKSIFSLSKKLNWKTDSPEHYIGYTMFFNGLYWIFENLNPSNVYTLGFDHDYNVEKYNKWKELGEPNPQNNYNNLDITKEFSEFKNDSFYGISTPDPLRKGLGLEYLKEKFILAQQNADLLNIKLWNLSENPSEVNIFEKIKEIH
jgi:hypothetical protein